MTQQVTTADGRQLEVAVSGPDDGYPLVFHSGTPSAVVAWPAMEKLTADAGLRSAARGPGTAVRRRAPRRTGPGASPTTSRTP
jgi:pimeloyl-ACP methyl ester carboxylesterase